MHDQPPDKDPNIESIDLFPTTIAGRDFISVRLTNRPKPGINPVAYIFLRYEISKDHVLHLWFMDVAKVEAAIKAGKLKGTITTPKSTRPSIIAQTDDVELTDSSEKIADFIRHADIDALFDDPGVDHFRN